MTLSVLVVCLGNICRSPVGEAVLRDAAAKRGVDIVVDSAGTAGYHAGEDPDERSIVVCANHNLRLNHKSRQVTRADFTRFTHILAADESNLRNLERIRPRNATADVRLWGSYLADEDGRGKYGRSIPDPYYGGIDGFEECYLQCLRLSDAFLDTVSRSASSI